jgi:putative SOS response-associated peptidase YedK
MCGRYIVVSPGEAIAAHFALDAVPLYRASYNVAPTAFVPVIRLNEQGLRECASLRWGLVPPWAKSLAAVPMLNNARAESIATKPAFRDAYTRRRCIVPADGYFEWDEKVKPHRPHFFRLEAGGLLGMAGLWERWIGPDGKPLESFAIVTQAADAQTAPIHDRMPRLLASGEYAEWLGAPDPAALLARPVALRLASHPVSASVNRVANDSAANIAPDDTSRPSQGALF